MSCPSGRINGWHYKWSRILCYVRHYMPKRGICVMPLILHKPVVWPSASAQSPNSNFTILHLPKPYHKWLMPQYSKLAYQNSRHRCMMPAAQRHFSQAPQRHLSMASKAQGSWASGKHMPLVQGPEGESSPSTPMDPSQPGSLLARTAANLNRAVPCRHIRQFSAGEIVMAMTSTG